MLKELRALLIAVVAVLVAIVVGPNLVYRYADAQPVPSVVGPYNIDLGAVITNTAQIGGAAGDGIFGTPGVANLDQSGVICTAVATVNSGSPSVTFSIQAFDAATASYRNLATSGAMTATATPTTVIVAPGAVATSVPSGVTIAGVPLPRVWRVSETVGPSSSSGVTAKIGCNYFK